MKCYELQGPSGIDGLALVDKPVPEPGQGEVLVRLKAATLNYRDLLTVKGGYGSRQKFPLVPVSDGAAHVTVAAALPPVAEAPVGAAGARGVAVPAVGITAFDAPDATLVPTLFLAVTTNV